MQNFLLKVFIFSIMIIGALNYCCGQQIRNVSYDELQNDFLNDTSSFVILNFWATWCKPCIEELPEFEKINSLYRSRNVRVILANLDFNSKVESTVIPLIQSKNLNSELVHITDTDPNEWINKASPDWSGAIPFTLISYKGKKIWNKTEKITFEELESIILNKLKL